VELKDVTFVSGLWLVDRNPKRSAAHYFEHLGATLEMIGGGNLLFFYNDERIKAVVSEGAERSQIALQCVHCPIEELAAYDKAKAMISRFSPEKSKWLSESEEKTFNHYWRDFKIGGPRVLGDMTSIWMSKISLVAESSILINRFSTHNFCWVDASISRFEKRRTGWDFTRLDLDGSRIAHYGSKLSCRGRQLPLNASFIYGGAGAWREFNALYQKVLGEKVYDNDYLHDEETIISYCVEQQPGLFKKIGDPVPNKRKWRGIRRLFQRSEAFNSAG